MALQDHRQSVQRLDQGKLKASFGEFAEDQEPNIIGSPVVDSYRENMVHESVHEALNSLPEIYHEVMTLRYFSGMTVKEMSRFLGVSSNTIDRRLKEAQIRLKEEMLAMMNTTYEQHKLPASFTFRVVEMVKRIRIQPITRTAGLPAGNGNYHHSLEPQPESGHSSP